MNYEVPDVVEIHSVYAPSVHWFTFIAPDHMAGRRHRYSVVRVDRKTGQAHTIGRELPLGHAREIAKRGFGSEEQKQLLTRSA